VGRHEGGGELLREKGDMEDTHRRALIQLLDKGWLSFDARSEWA